MKKSIQIFLFILTLFIVSCNNNNSSNKNFHSMLDAYWEDYLKLFPMEATAYGDNRYNDLLPNNISVEFLKSQKDFYQKYKDTLTTFDSSSMNENDKISFQILANEMNLGIEGLQFPNELLPINQFDCLPLTFAMYGSGEGNQPFETANDYTNFLKRIDAFEIWSKTAINNMNEGIKQKIVLPKLLCEKIIQQYKEITDVELENSVFYKPIKNFPKDFSESLKDSFKTLYINSIQQKLNPAYKSMATFLQQKYLPYCRNTDGWDALPKGNSWYEFMAKKWTTTNMTPDEIKEMGYKEVEFLRSEIEKIKSNMGFEGDLVSFFNFCNDNKKFMPFTEDKQIIDSFGQIYDIEKKYLPELFLHQPKTKFEIRQTEEFREKTASAEYIPASEDGSRPGIFYVPIPDPTKFNVIGMQTLFLHEAIPGHHFQSSLQQENNQLPKFRRFIWYGAYGEGWALYAESLGKQVGLLNDDLQYLGHLSDAMLRAVRLVVDVSLHRGTMTHDQAINYMMSNMRISKEEATQEIERYMANPGQALSYMVGKKKILSLRDNAKQRLGNKFDIKKFHDVVLKNGCVPLKILESEVNKMN